MSVATVRKMCAAFPGAVAEFPFGPGVCVYKAGHKLFALVPENAPFSVSLKCDPVLARVLRERFAAVTPGYHLNKQHWNTVALDGTVPRGDVAEMITHSYELVVASLTKRVRAELGIASGGGN